MRQVGVMDDETQSAFLNWTLGIDQKMAQIELDLSNARREAARISRELDAMLARRAAAMERWGKSPGSSV